jgi:endoglucanase
MQEANTTPAGRVDHDLSRRGLLAAAAGAAAGALLSRISVAAPATRPGPLPEPTAAKLPAWRGFNLLEKFSPGYGNDKAPFREADFDIIADWGFNFVRLPCSYLFWSSQKDLYKIDEAPLKQIDQAIRFGRQRNIHVSLNFHRIPGYCINPPKEPTNIFEDQATLDAACFQWQHFAKRYRGIPSANLSFDLMNEPPSISDEAYLRVHGRLAEAIHEVDPDRLVICDGKGGGHTPVKGVDKFRMAQSTRGYQPFGISHYKAAWVGGSDKWPVPTWPLVERKDGKQVTWDRQRLREDRITPWQALEATGVGIHIGEWGCHNMTPHDVALAWMRENLELWAEAGWGWGLWNLRGSFGVLNSSRKDVTYERFRKMNLDRKMLVLLQETSQT